MSSMDLLEKTVSTSRSHKTRKAFAKFKALRGKKRCKPDNLSFLQNSLVGWTKELKRCLDAEGAKDHSKFLDGEVARYAPKPTKVAAPKKTAKKAKKKSA